MYSSLAEALHGRVAVRAARQTARAQAAFYRTLDGNGRAYFAVVAQARWLGCDCDFARCALKLSRV